MQKKKQTKANLSHRYNSHEATDARMYAIWSIVNAWNTYCDIFTLNVSGIEVDFIIAIRRYTIIQRGSLF